MADTCYANPYPSYERQKTELAKEIDECMRRALLAETRGWTGLATRFFNRAVALSKENHGG